MKVIGIQDAHDETSWDDYVLGHPESSGYHTLAWRGVIADVFGHRTFYLMAKDDGDIVHGVLPLVLTKSSMFGSFLTSLPFLNYGGVLADHEQARQALLQAAAGVAKDVGAAHIELRQSAPIESDWPVRTHKVSMRLPLPPDYEMLLKSFPSKLRSQIKRAKKEGMDVHVAGEELLDEYYAIFSRCMRDLGTPVYAKNFFQTIVRTFLKDVRFCVVSLRGRPLAAGLVYGFRRTLEIPWAASDKRFNKLSPNMLLYSSVLEYACGEGYAEFDFGRSSVDGGTYRFKEQWGARPQPLYWYYWLADGRDLPQLNPDNPKYHAAISVWQHLPLPVANCLGPHIVKYLP